MVLCCSFVTPVFGSLTPVMCTAAAAWYAEFLHHMSVQQQANLGAYPGMWPWTYQSQMAAQAMNAAAMGLHAAPGLAKLQIGRSWPAHRSLARLHSMKKQAMMLCSNNVVSLLTLIQYGRC